VYDVYCTQSAFTARAPHIHFVETIDPAYLESLPQFITQSIYSAEEFLIVYISKSGVTTESATNFEVVFSLLKNIFGVDETKSRTVVITETASPLAQKAIQESLTLLTMPPVVGGRFSIFSAAGLFPLVAAGVPAHELLASAQTAEENLFSEDVTKNPALASAGILLHYLQKKYAVYDLFMFNPALESLGKWYRQLHAESLGKGDALLPEVSVGTTDLHATAQLYIEGPQNRITTLVRLTEPSSVTIPHEETLETVQGLAGKTPEAVHAAIYAGVTTAYAEKGIPFTEVVLQNPASCGSFMHAKMIETLLVAHSVNINPFNQPAVELYKSKARRLLEE
jgi:glucose-6-phosphate isomerase